jgi:esterase/lipase superfamily enzyme
MFHSTFASMRSCLAGVLLLLILGCAANRGPSKDDHAPREPTYATCKVFYSTDRIREERDSPRVFYGGTRSAELEYGLAHISIPASHEEGVVEHPKWYKLEFKYDPEKHITILGAQPLAEESWYDTLSSSVGAATERSALIFVHGYNVDFDEALRRTAQLAFDLVFPGVPILYSWPSNGSLFGYSSDEEDARFTVPHLKYFLQGVHDRTGAENIYVIAHSMGCRAIVEALATMASDTPLVHQLILAAPDIDAEVFKRDLAPAMCRLTTHCTLYASSQDRALAMSRELHQNARAGEVRDSITIVPHIDTIDASGIDTDLLGHSAALEEAALLDDIKSIICCATAPGKRRLRPMTNNLNESYWRFGSQR